MSGGLLPWADLLRAGQMRGLAPDAMWRLSLREWLWLTARGAPGGDAAAMAPDRLAALMAAYPDDPDPEETPNG